MARNHADFLKYACAIDTAFGATKFFWCSETLRLQIVLTVFPVILRRVTLAFLTGAISAIDFAPMMKFSLFQLSILKDFLGDL
jgi:hypothetical protein